MALSRRSLLAAAAACVGAGLRPAAAQAQWQAASAYPDTNFHTRNLREFIEDVGKATSGGVQLRLHSNGSLLKMSEIKRGLQDARVQMGEILLSAYGEEDPIFEVDSIPQLVLDIEGARKLADLSRPLIEARLARQGLMLLYTVPWPPSGLYTSVPVESAATLRGMKMRTFNAMMSRFATLAGATPTLVEQSELPQAFMTKAIDAMITSAATGVDTQAWDYVRHFTPIGFTRTKNAVLVSARSFEALPQDAQAAIREAARTAERRGWAASEWERVERQNMLASRGMTVTEPSSGLLEELGRIGRTITEEWIERAGEAGRRLIKDYDATRGAAQAPPG